MVFDFHGRALALSAKAVINLAEVFIWTESSWLVNLDGMSEIPFAKLQKSLTLVFNLNAGHTRQSGFPLRIRDFLPLLSNRFSFLLFLFSQF
jgi:hypothetical protein